MWSSHERPGEDGRVVEETVVWMVPLRAGAKEYKGALTLEPPNLVFTERGDGDRVELPLAEVRRVRRVRGSPVMRIALGDRPNRHEVAFYFSQPPPLKPPATSGTARRTMFGPLGGAIGGGVGGGGAPDRTTKRVMRTNVGYLSQAAANLRSLIDEWVAAIETAREEAPG
jgi:hypothetical protein